MIHRQAVAKGALAVFALFAYRALWLEPPNVDVDSLVFLPGRLPAWLVVSVALWLAWRRRGRLRDVNAWATGIPERPSNPRPRGASFAPAAAIVLALSGTALFIWSTLTGKTDLLLPALAAHGLMLAVLWAGPRGLWIGLLPAAVLMLGIRFPKPLEDEIVWRLQVWTARGSGWLLDAFGQSFVQSGVILRNDEHVFHVIDSCSGLNGIMILMLIAVVVQELFRDEGGPPTMVLFLAASPLAFALNLFRVAYVAASPEPEKLAGVGGDHTLQGLIVLMVGTLLLYALGWAVAAYGRRRHGTRASRSETTHSPCPPARPGDDEEEARAADMKRRAGPIVAVVAIGLVVPTLASVLLPRFPTPKPIARQTTLEIPEERAGWTSDRAPHELLFTGVFSSGLHRRYELDSGPRRPLEIVELLVAFEDVTRPNATRLFSSKARVPGPEWQILRHEPARLWLLDRDGERIVASRDPTGAHAVAYTWRVHDRGVIRESIRSFLALDLSPCHRARPRALVRLVAYAPNGDPLVLDWTRRRLDRFIRDFREGLEGIEGIGAQ